MARIRIRGGADFFGSAKSADLHGRMAGPARTPRRADSAPLLLMSKEGRQLWALQDGDSLQIAVYASSTTVVVSLASSYWYT